MFPVASPFGAGEFFQKSVLAILNDTDQEQDISVRLDLKKLQVKVGLKGHDAFEPELKWTLSDEWKGKIGPRGFRLIVFK